MNTSHRRPHVIPALFAVLAVVTLADMAFAQLPRLGDAADKLKKHTPNVSSILEGKPPITTSLSDAKYGVDSTEGTMPASARPLMSLQRTLWGGFTLRPGYYVMQTQSYCLKAGTHGPGGGDGYLYAPPLGPAEEAVVSIVRNSVSHEEIPQHEIQLLLWAIIARAKFEDLSPQLKVTAARLLTPKQIAMLNRGALDMVPGPILQEALNKAPAPVRATLEAEANLRRMLTTAGSTFAEMERVAVLGGMAPLGEGSRVVPSGKWSLHPDGYYVRYIPSGYSSTRLEIWVPEGSSAVGKECDPALHVAVPGNTARQRLIQSGRVHQ
jgi:hypothetical protein